MLGAPGGEGGRKVLSWPVEDSRSAMGTDFLKTAHVNKAKELAYKSDKQQGECKDTKFVDHRITYVTLPDGRRGVRFFLVGESGGQKLVASGDEDAKGSSQYQYKKVDTFKTGPPLNTTRIGEVRSWLEKVLGQPL